jgi:MULE transposase domain
MCLKGGFLLCPIYLALTNSVEQFCLALVCYKHGTNTYKLKLGLLTTVDGNGATRVLAASLLLNETAEAFKWTFQCFLESFRVPPNVLFTDGDAAMAVAVEAIFPITHHLLCTWHLSKNVLTNIRPVFCGDSAAWQVFKSTWWKICLRSDKLAVSLFDDEWSKLVDLLPSHRFIEKSNIKLEKCMSWLESLRLKRKRWAARWTWNHFTMGVHSTQRAEAVHSAISGFLSASMLLVDLLEKLDNYGCYVAEKGKSKMYRESGKHSTTDLAPILSSICDRVSPFALQIVGNELIQSQHYLIRSRVQSSTEEKFISWDITRIQDKSNDCIAGMTVDQRMDELTGFSDVEPIPIVLSHSQHETTLKECSCQFPTCWGVPCRYMLRLFSVMQIQDICSLVDTQWKNVSAKRQGQLLTRRAQVPKLRPRSGGDRRYYRHGNATRRLCPARAVSKFEALWAAAAAAVPSRRRQPPYSVQPSGAAAHSRPPRPPRPPCPPRPRPVGLPNGAPTAVRDVRMSRVTEVLMISFAKMNGFQGTGKSK